MKLRHWAKGHVTLPASALLTRYGWVFLWTWVTSWARFYYWSWRQRRILAAQAKAKNIWTAVSPSGNVNLGECTQAEATERVAKFGTVSYVDTDRYVVIYDAHLGGHNIAAGKM